jgi:hypothetical protein
LDIQQFNVMVAALPQRYAVFQPRNTDSLHLRPVSGTCANAIIRPKLSTGNSLLGSRSSPAKAQHIRIKTIVAVASAEEKLTGAVMDTHQLYITYCSQVVAAVGCYV